MSDEDVAGEWSVARGAVLASGLDEGQRRQTGPPGVAPQLTRLLPHGGPLARPAATGAGHRVNETGDGDNWGSSHKGRALGREAGGQEGKGK